MGPSSAAIIRAALLIALLTFVGATGWGRQLFVSQSGKDTLAKQCFQWESELKRSQDTTKASGDLRGIWVSQRCEIRPGPKYILRRYQMMDSGQFRLMQFHYRDPRCSSPDFALEAHGRYVAPPKRSWVVPGGYEADYVMLRVTVLPYDDSAAGILSEKVNRSCSNVVLTPWKTHRRYRILNYGASGNEISTEQSYECTEALNISFDELQLMRVEHRTYHAFHRLLFNQHSSQKDKDFVAELYLGAQPSAHAQRTRPTHYQEPLLNTEVTDCSACRLVAKSSIHSPPRFSHYKGKLIFNISGDWSSVRCEVRPLGLFLRRRLHLKELTGYWSGSYKYFRDANCRKPMFDIWAEGYFRKGSPSSFLPDAYDVDFEVSQISMTPRDPFSVANFNGGSACGETLWTVGKTQDLSSTGGCDILGLKVPSIEYDVVMIDHYGDVILLYLSEDTEGSSRTHTSFQPPLVQCSDTSPVDNTIHPLPLFLPMRSISPVISSYLQLTIILPMSFAIHSWGP